MRSWFKTSKIVITGGVDFVGSNNADSRANSHEIIVNNLDPYYSSNINKSTVDCVYHGAAHTGATL